MRSFLYWLTLFHLAWAYNHTSIAHHRKTANEVHRNKEMPKSRGIALCTGTKMIDDAFAIIEQIRRVWNSSMPVYIAHCSEIDSSAFNIQSKFNNVYLLNICEKNDIFGMDNSTKFHRLRSWWCKAASIILAPVDEVMIVDLDVIFFKNPELLFNAQGYIETGALFFRDRVMHDRNRKNEDDKLTQDMIEDLIISEAPELNITSAEVARYKQQQHHHTRKNGESSNGVSGMALFFSNILDRSIPPLVNHQDSSVIVVDRTRHPKFLTVLGNLLPRFNIGWGDKELYWVSAIISDEPFAFEPFLIGSYGDCGLMMHYDPTAGEDSDTDSVEPFYINAEWLIEKGHMVGIDLEYTMPNPALVTETMQLHNLAASRGCTCRFHGCREVPYSVNQHILRALWERKSRSLRDAALRSKRQVHTMASIQEQTAFYRQQCVSIFKSAGMQISAMINEFYIKNSVCHDFGCPFVPIPIKPGGDTICVPVTFTYTPQPFRYTSYVLPYKGDNCSTILNVLSNISDEPSTSVLSLEREVLYNVTIAVQTPRKYEPKELIRFSSGKQVYQVGEDGKLHGVPNFKTFLALGLDFDDVHVVADEQQSLAQIGDMLQEQ